MKKFAFITILITVLQACGTNGVFEKTEALPSHNWASAKRVSTMFDVQDTAAYYNLYIIFTHTDAYHYNNIYLNITTIAPGDTAITVQKQLQLAKNNYGWLGTAMDDIIEHRVLLNERGPVKLKKGNYTFVLQQAMRENPLTGVINAGMRAEKVIQ